MKKEDIKELLLKSLTEDLTEAERLVIESEAISDSSFSYGFADRIIARIEKGSLFLKPDFINSLNLGFRRVALTGVAAILLLTVSLLLSQGSLSYDTLLGIDNQIDDSLVSLLIE